jgi:hypothetical protein
MSTRCEKVVAAMATGGPFRRWRAMRHAARCPHCAAARDKLRQVALALADVPPLTDAQRRLWAAAAVTEFTAEPARAWWLRPAMAGAFATVILIAAGVWWASRPWKLRPAPPGIASVPPPTVNEETLPEVDVLRGDVVALARELDELLRRAELLEARKDVEALMARLAPPSGASGL